MENQASYCEWCGRETDPKPVHVGGTPILEDLEQRIDEFGREEIWGELSDWSELELDSGFEAELLVYDELLQESHHKIVCDVCLVHDNKLFDKYYNDEELVGINYGTIPTGSDSGIIGDDGLIA